MKLTVGNRGFTILVQEEPKGGFTGRCLELRGAVSYGKTMKELKVNMKDAITLVLDVNDLARKLRSELRGVDVEAIAKRVEKRSNEQAKKKYKSLRH